MHLRQLVGADTPLKSKDLLGPYASCLVKNLTPSILACCLEAHCKQFFFRILRVFIFPDSRNQDIRLDNILVLNPTRMIAKSPESDSEAITACNAYTGIYFAPIASESLSEPYT